MHRGDERAARTGLRDRARDRTARRCRRAASRDHCARRRARGRSDPHQRRNGSLAARSHPASDLGGSRLRDSRHRGSDPRRFDGVCEDGDALARRGGRAGRRTDRSIFPAVRARWRRRSTSFCPCCRTRSNCSPAASPTDEAHRDLRASGAIPAGNDRRDRFAANVVQARSDARADARTRRSASDVSDDPRRRNQRQRLDVHDDRLGAAGFGKAHGAAHQAAPAFDDGTRAHRRRRGCAGTIRGGARFDDARHRSDRRRLRTPDVLRNAAGAGVYLLRAGARRRRGDRSRPRRPARRHQRHPAGRRRDHVDRLRSHRGARRYARGDRGRKSRYRETRSTAGRRGASGRARSRSSSVTPPRSARRSFASPKRCASKSNRPMREASA